MTTRLNAWEQPFPLILPEENFDPDEENDSEIITIYQPRGYNNDGRIHCHFPISDETTLEGLFI
ncbi:MAG: hypothetical protein WCG84_04015 [Candidatus Moraniibacteriota bacterium]